MTISTHTPRAKAQGKCMLPGRCQTADQAIAYPAEPAVATATPPTPGEEKFCHPACSCRL
jgi:hypothetical protein